MTLQERRHGGCLGQIPCRVHCLALHKEDISALGDRYRIVDPSLEGCRQDHCKASPKPKKASKNHGGTLLNAGEDISQHAPEQAIEHHRDTSRGNQLKSCPLPEGAPEQGDERCKHDHASSKNRTQPPKDPVLTGGCHKERMTPRPTLPSLEIMQNTDEDER